MLNSYLLELIQALSAEERLEFQWFLQAEQASLGASYVDITSLYNAILKAEPLFSEENLRKERIYDQIFPKQKFVAGKLDKLMSELTKLLRKYALATRYLSPKNDLKHQIDWAAWLRERGLGVRSAQAITKLKKHFEVNNAESLERYQILWLMAEEEHNWHLYFNKVKGGLHLPELIHHFDLYFQNYRTDRINRYLLQQKGANLPDLNFNIASLEDNLAESPFLQLSKNIRDVLKNDYPTMEDTQNLLQFLQQNEAGFSFETLDNTYAYLRSFCTMLINSGDLGFVPILHEINKDNLERGYFFQDGGIPPNSYANLVQVAIRAHDVEWAKKMTEEYKERIIGSDDREFFYQMNMAFCHFAAGELDAALDVLPDTSSSSHYHHMIRRLEIKIYYEKGSDLLHYKMDAFRKYLERTAPKTIAAPLREMDVNFINIILQLVQSPPKDKARAERLKARIQSKKMLAERGWLLEKVNQLS